MEPCTATHVKNCHTLLGQEQPEPQNPQASIDWFKKPVIPSCNRAIGIFFNCSSPFKSSADANARPKTEMTNKAGNY